MVSDIVRDIRTTLHNDDSGAVADIMDSDRGLLPPPLPKLRQVRQDPGMLMMVNTFTVCFISRFNLASQYL
jgi:hypothetical protein